MDESSRGGARRGRRLLGLSGLIALAVLLLVPPLQAETLRVHAASSLTDVMEEIAAAYTSDTGTIVRLNFGGSAALAREIELGSPGDLFISADEQTMNVVQGKGWAVADTRRSILSNSLVIIVPRDSTLVVHGAKSLASGSISRVALAEPQASAAGMYARVFLEAAGVWDQIAAGVVPPGDARAVLATVERGDVDAGIVYRTDAMTSEKVKVVYELRPGEAPYISYPAAVLSEAASPGEAARFIEYLTTDEARAIFETHGFVVR